MLTVLAPSRWRRYNCCGEGVPPQQSQGLVVVRYGQRQVDGRQQEEHVRLHHGDAEVQAEKYQRNADGNEREERQGDEVARGSSVSRRAITLNRPLRRPPSGSEYTRTF